MLAALPDIVRAAAEPMEHIDSLTVMSADGASEMVKNTTRVVAVSATAIKGLTGLDVPNLIGNAMRSGALAGVRSGDGECGGSAKPAAAPPAGTTPSTPAGAASATTATNGQSTTSPAPTLQNASAAVTTAMTGVEAAEDDAARLLATKLREIPNVSDYAHLRLSEVGSSGPRPMRLLWRIAEAQVGKRYGAMTVGELITRFGAQAQH